MPTITDLLNGVVEHEPMEKHTTFKIGGPARYFYEVTSKEDFVAALQAAEQSGIDYFILGGGSNLLVSDKGFNGLVIKQSDTVITIDGESVYAESGVILETLLLKTLDAGLTGWAWAAGLPGTVGGAIRGNAGAYGLAMSDITVSVELFKEGKVIQVPKDEMGFSYRHSMVKEQRCAVLSASLMLKKGDTTEDRALVEKYLTYRKQTQPIDQPNSGCIFKNIDLAVHPVDKERIIKELDINEEEYARATKYNKLPVSFIIDKMDLKGRQMGGAMVSDKHGAFIVNADHATAEHVIMLISDIKMKVRNKLGIGLEEEVQYVGF